MLKKHLSISVIVLPLLLMAGCFQTETWSTIDADGGFDRKIEIKIDESNKSQLAKKKSAFEDDGWTVSESESEYEDKGKKKKKYHLIANKKFEKVADFKDPFGDTEIKLEGAEGKWKYSEVFQAKKSAGISDTTKSSFGWEGLQYTFHLTVPGKVKDTNASKKEAGTVTWIYDHKDVFKKGTFTMSVDYLTGDAAAKDDGGVCGSIIFITGIGTGLFLFAFKFIFGWMFGLRRKFS